jgi:D-glycero-alpha-D-manno-heptose 1-phosphate guanylyltransferase
MEAIILAGGFGTRLKSVVTDVPKPMAPINGQPFLAFLLSYLEKQGFEKVILSVGYRHEVIIAYFKDRFRKIQVSYSVEHEPLGTGGAIKKALGLLESQLVFILNGDTFLEMDFCDMLSAHRESHADVTLALKQVSDVSRYGHVLTEGQRIIAFHEKGATGCGFINGGVYLLSANLFDRFDLPDTFSFEKDFLYPRCGELLLHGFSADGYFIDIGVPEDYLRAQSELRAVI